MPSNVRLLAAKIVSHFRREGIVGTLKRCGAAIEETRFDRKFGVDTIGFRRYTGIPDGYEHGLYLPYGPTKIGILKKIFRELPIKNDDFIFLDIGSGMGRTLLAASEIPFRRIVGVEFSPELHSIAQKNIRTYRSTTQKCKAVESICCDATIYEMPPENTVLYLYNPFKAQIMSKLLTNLRESLDSFPREVYVVYVGAVCHDLLIESGFLQVVSVTESYNIYNTTLPVRNIPNPELTTAVPGLH